MPIKKYKVRTSENEELKKILNRFNEVVIIGEDEKEDEELEPNHERIEEDIRAYKEAFGASRKAGEDSRKLIEASNRREEWRSNEND